MKFERPKFEIIRLEKLDIISKDFITYMIYFTRLYLYNY